MNLARPSVVLAALLTLCCGSPSLAQTQDKCAVYHSAVVSDGSGFIPVIPERLLDDWKSATPCLADVLRRLSATIKSPTFTPATRNSFLSVTGALRSIATKLGKEDAIPDEKRDEECKALPPAERSRTERCQKKLNIFIRTFRESDDVDVISALTYGARNENSDVRLNSLLILGDMIDNYTVCVPLTHLADPKISDGEQGITARANLLSVISVVSPWAFKENFQNIQNTQRYYSDHIKKDDKTLVQTVSILNNIQARLDVNKGDNNQKYSLSEKARGDCRKYIDSYQPALTSRDTVRY